MKENTAVTLSLCAIAVMIVIFIWAAASSQRCKTRFESLIELRASQTQWGPVTGCRILIDGRWLPTEIIVVPVDGGQ